MQVIWIAHTIDLQCSFAAKLDLVSVRKVSTVDYFFDYAFLGPKESKYDHLVGYLSYKGH